MCWQKIASHSILSFYRVIKGENWTNDIILVLVNKDYREEAVQIDFIFMDPYVATDVVLEFGVSLFLASSHIPSLLLSW